MRLLNRSGVVMNAIRIRKHIESDTLVLPELRSLIGKDAEIIVLVDDGTGAANGRDLSAFFEAAERCPVDPEALDELRDASKT